MPGRRGDRLRRSSREIMAGHKALGEMAQPVKMVPAEIEEVLNPVPDRHPGIGIMPADNEDERMQEHEAVEEGS